MRDYIEIIECMRYGILTEDRGRMDYLANTYGDKLRAKWQTEIQPAAIKTAVDAMPGEGIAQKLIAYIATFDPSQNGQYTQWMVLRYLKNALSLQLLPTTKNHLELFATMKARKQLAAGQGDINAFQSFNDLAQGMKQHRAAQLPAKLEVKWKATSGAEPENVQVAVFAQKGKTVGDKLLAYISTFDPSGGKHTFWLGNAWLTNGLKLEDLEAARDYLRLFDEKSSGVLRNVDLDKVRSLSQLAKMVRPSEGESQEVAIQDDDEESRMLEQAEVMYDDDELRILKPLTKAAACYFGRNTEWCTAWGNHTDLGLSKQGRWPDRTNQFDSYVRKGPLYIITIKPQFDENGAKIKGKGRKTYQYHSETNQFANIKDEMLSGKAVSKLLDDYPEIHETIGEALDTMDMMYTRYGMTPALIEKIDNGLPSGLGSGSYDKDNKRFIVERWSNFEKFLGSVYDETVEKILEIATEQSDLQQDLLGDVREEFVRTILELPPQWQERMIARAGVRDEGGLSERAAITAANKLMRDQDEWYLLFEELFNSGDDLKNEAWERLGEYAEIGWVYAGNGVYDNIPTSREDFEHFVLSQAEVHLYVDEKDMIGYAEVGDGDDDEDGDRNYDDDYVYGIMKMRGDSGGRADWETLDDEYMSEKRREAGLIDSEEASMADKWLEEIKEDGGTTGMLVQNFIDALSGNTPKPRIKDDRQRELKFEGLKRLMVLAGILKG